MLVGELTIDSFSGPMGACCRCVILDVASPMRGGHLNSVVALIVSTLLDGTSLGEGIASSSCCFSVLSLLVSFLLRRHRKHHMNASPIMQTGTITAAAMMAELTPLEEDDDDDIAVAVPVAVAAVAVAEPVAAWVGVSVTLAVGTMRGESVQDFVCRIWFSMHDQMR